MKGFVSFGSLRIAYHNGYRYLIGDGAKNEIQDFLNIGNTNELEETEGWCFGDGIRFEKA